MNYFAGPTLRFNDLIFLGIKAIVILISIFFIVTLLSCDGGGGGGGGGDGSNDNSDLSSFSYDGIWNLNEKINLDNDTIDNNALVEISQNGQTATLAIHGSVLQCRIIEEELCCTGSINSGQGRVRNFSKFNLLYKDENTIDGYADWTAVYFGDIIDEGTSELLATRADEESQPSPSEVEPPRYLNTILLFPGNLDIVQLSWKISLSPNVIKYCVYRSTMPNVVPQSGLLRDEISADRANAYGVILINDDDVFHKGETYYYIVTAVNSNGVESNPSNEAKIKIPY